MKNNFKGWTTVYGFTFRQAMNKSFKLITTLIAILIIGVIILINVITAKPEKVDITDEDLYIENEISDAHVSPIKKVLVMDQSGLQPTDYISMDPGYYGNYFSDVEYTSVEGKTRSEILDAASEDSNRTVAVIINYNNGLYEMEALVPHNSIIIQEEVELLVGQMMMSFDNNKIRQTNLNEEQLAAAFTSITLTYSEFGESTNMAALAIKIIAPMIFSFMLYFMLIFYSQNVSKSVSTEKTSKLMETLLTSIHPNSLITGKVLAVTSLGIIQFVSWIISGIIGLYVGNAIAHGIYPEYENSVLTFINFVKDNIGETGMTLPAILLAIIVFGVGFLFYCVLAALAGSMVSKPEDVASTQLLFTFPILISWMLSYFAPITGNAGLITAIRYIPFTSPFCVPSDLITGTIGLGEGLLSLLILAVFSFILIILSSKIYKGLVLYTGNKVNLKVLAKILKS